MSLSINSRVFEFVSSDLITGLLEYGHTAVDGTTGWPGLGVIFVYSFLIVFMFLDPSEVVLAAPLDLGVPLRGHPDLIIGVGATGKVVESLVVFYLGQEAKQADPITRWLRRSWFDAIEWPERRTVSLARRYRYGDLALVPCIPFFPDTLSIYAFATLEEDYLKFTLAMFMGSLGRLAATLSLFGGVISVL